MDEAEVNKTAPMQLAVASGLTFTGQRGFEPGFPASASHRRDTGL